MMTPSAKPCGESVQGFPRHFLRTFRLLPADCCGEQAPVPIIGKVDLRPGLRGTLDTGAQAPVWQNVFGGLGNQDRVAEDNGVFQPNLLHQF